jgi:hypothetical protein
MRSPNNKPKDYTTIIFLKFLKFRQLYANPLPYLPSLPGWRTDPAWNFAGDRA